MKALPCLSACVLAGSLAGAPTWAQPTPPLLSAALPAVSPSTTAPQASPVSLSAALEAAWARAVSARETDGERLRAEADRAVADSLWAAPPSLAINHRDDRLQGNAGRRETEVGLALPLWLPGQRAARGATAEAALAQARAAVEVARLRLAGELREAAWAVVALQAEASQARLLAQALQAQSDDVARRVRAGDLAPADAMAAQAEQLGAVARQSELQQRLLAAHARWTLLTGLPAAPALSLQVPEPTAHAQAAAHPELQWAQRSTALARQRLELLQRSRRDAPELSFSLRQDTPGRAAAAQGSLAVGLRLPLGTADRNRPLEAAALSALSVAQAQEERLRERLDSDVLSAQAALQAAQAQLQSEASRAQLLRERARLIDQSFRAGETALPELLRAQAAAAQADSALTRQTAALGLARARLQQAFGQMP